MKSHIEGIALWTPRLSGWDVAREVLRGDRPPPETLAARPTPALLPAAERRRAPDAVALALEVAARACEGAKCDPAALASVFASTEGDLSISDYMSATLASTPLLVSPTKFHNSVHNAPAGYWTIATGSMQPYTALSAHSFTFANGLLEALVQSQAADERMLLVAYDIEARGPLATMTKSRGLLAAALVLNPIAQADTAIEMEWDVTDESNESGFSRQSNESLPAGNALDACLPLFEALAIGGAQSVALRLSPGKSLRLQLTAAAGESI